jgi:hypothetical protein
MKLIILLLISLPTLASNWVPVSKIESRSSQAYQLKADCENRSGEQCLDVGDRFEQVALGYATLQDHYEKTKTETCADPQDCEAKFQALDCTQEYAKIKNLDLLQVYCTKLVGKKLVLDEAGWSAYEAAMNAENAFKAALDSAKALRECGTRVMDLVLVRNASKVLNTTQVKAMVGIYAPIKGLLETGSLNSAREEVQAIEPDGTLVTSGDKVAVIAAIDKCLGL